MEKSEKKNNAKKKTNWKYWIVAIIICLILGIIATFVANSMFGTVTTTGGFPEDVKDVSLSCENTGLAYPIFTYDNSEKKETKITGIFHGDEPKNLSLVYIMTYKDQNSAIGSEAHNHAAMNISFGQDNLSPDSLTATYSKSNGKMQMTLFANSSDLKKETTMKYFLLNEEGNSEVPKTEEEYKKNYEKKGFSCSVSD